MITRQLVRAAQNQDPQARKQIADEMHDVFDRALRRRKVDAEAREDLCQQALEIMLRKMGEFRWRARFESWGLAILFNCHLRHLQKQKRTQERTVQTPQEGPAPVDMVADRPANDPFWHVYRRQLAEALSECLSRISLAMREVWIQHRLLGHDYKRIAEDMHLKIDTVGTRIFRVDAKMRQCLEAKNYTPATLAVAG